MAGNRGFAAAQPTFIVKEILLGIAVGLVAAGSWKKMHMDQKKRAKLFYEGLDRGDVTVVSEE